jgi:hypothetical protein
MMTITDHKVLIPSNKLSTVYEQRAEKSHIQQTNATIEI